MTTLERELGVKLYKFRAPFGPIEVKAISLDFASQRAAFVWGLEEYQLRLFTITK